MPLASSFTELPLLSTISMAPAPSLSVIFWPPGVSAMNFSWPLVSSSVIFTPLRDRSTFLSFLPPSIDAGGESLPFHSPPITYGRRVSPPSKATRTSSFVSGTNQLPRLLPPIIVARRAHASYRAPALSADHGNVTFTRPCASGSLMSVTSAG